MTADSKLANCINKGDFIITAEYLPRAAAGLTLKNDVLRALSTSVQAVNVSDNPFGIGMSSLAGSVALNNSKIEPIYQLVTRDRNRIALASDLLGAASLGIKNVLCLSGYHQSLTQCPGSANVYDIDSIQLIAAITHMNDEKVLPCGTKIEGDFALLPGAVANPDIEPVELNLIRLAKKVQAGAKFIQTQAVFNVKAFAKWLEAAEKEGITKKAAVLAGVMPLDDADEAEKLCKNYTEFLIPDEIISRLKKAGDKEAQRKEGLKISIEIIKEIKKLPGLRGIHIISGAKEDILPELLSASGLGKQG